MLIGGFAVIARGLERPTKDIDLLIDASAENVERVKRALAVLPDNAVREVKPDEVERYDVIRVADEVVVDSMAKACGVTWEDADRDFATQRSGASPRLGLEDWTVFEPRRSREVVAEGMRNVRPGWANPTHRLVADGWQYWTKFEPPCLLRDIYRDGFSIFIRSARKKLP